MKQTDGLPRGEGGEGPSCALGASHFGEFQPKRTTMINRLFWSQRAVRAWDTQETCAAISLRWSALASPEGRRRQ